MLDAVRGQSRFRRAFEIGCAEGGFTEILESRCESVLAVDLSPVAVARASSRRLWDDRVRFRAWDLRLDPLPGAFDLIVLCGVLELLYRPSALRSVWARLVDALDPGGCLLLQTTYANPVVERAWWGRYFLRGKWIDAYARRHPALEVVATQTASYCIRSLFRKRQSAALLSAPVVHQAARALRVINARGDSSSSPGDTQVH
jgi:SAM-dependent methyltransferase